TTYIAIHDGARALVSPADVDRVIAAALDSGAATAAHPVYDTVKKISANMRGAEILDTETGNIDAAANSAAAGDTLTGKPVTVERDGLWAVQTPQVFELARYRAAINDNYEDATDDCQLFERRSWPVTLVHTSAYNIKLTTPEDVVATRALLGGGGIRVGHGYDAHRLVTGRRLILGGVDIPFDKGLLGHSDADVLLHAVMDALLGAAGLGDIGGRFPDTDEAYRDADSLGLLRTVIEELPLQVGNIDATVVCQAPKLAPYMDQMRGNIARACGTSPARVNVKATTEEGMGFTGTGEGIAAHAVVMLYGE
ncbi:MAG: 2-C-methyl-D-erythritol 2,4-cyclodiphosphate synthase, partial [Oscillospiraceae bacterium]|nr:2-C-methyl-D-erythritol 2,4-cyclodiphosphate synthase [Oscillospiraceae bacterium]